MFTTIEMLMLRPEFFGMQRNSPGVTVFPRQMPFAASLGKGKATRNVKVPLETDNFLHYVSLPIYVSLSFPELHC